MGTGFLKVQLYVGDFALHGDSVTVLVKKDGEILHTLQADENGTTEVVSIEAPSLAGVDGLEVNETAFFSTVDVEVPKAQGYKGVKVYGVQIFDGITSILPVHMEPIAPGESSDTTEIHIPREHGVDIDRDNGQPDNHEPGQGPEADNGVMPEERPVQSQQQQDPAPPSEERPASMDAEAYAQQAIETFEGDSAALIGPLNVPLANEVVIPDFITVHLGWPNAAARNVRVPFRDYIVNVVCSEIYPFWERAAIEANTHAIVSFTLNRLFTHWYRSRGRNFDITNTTQVCYLLRYKFSFLIIHKPKIYDNLLRAV